jgi:arylsulfatase A-like enzyme
MRFPGRMTPSFLEGDPLVSTLDIMPTLLALTGTPIPAQCEGRDLFGPAGGLTAQYGITEGKARGVFGDGSFALRDERYQLVVVDAALRTDPDDWSSSRWVMFDPGTPSRYELYDLQNDPFELKDIAQEKPEVLGRLRQVANEHGAHTGMSNPSAPKAPGATISEETKAYLEAQGYLPGKDKKKQDK